MSTEISTEESVHWLDRNRKKTKAEMRESSRCKGLKDWILVMGTGTVSGWCQ